MKQFTDIAAAVDRAGETPLTLPYAMATGNPNSRVSMMKTAGTELMIPPRISPERKESVRLRNVIC